MGVRPHHVMELCSSNAAYINVKAQVWTTLHRRGSKKVQLPGAQDTQGCKNPGSAD